MTIPTDTILTIKGGECYGRRVITQEELFVGSRIEILGKMWTIKSIGKNTVKMETWYDKQWGDDELLERIYKY
jgi:hypothetical protein